MGIQCPNKWLLGELAVWHILSGFLYVLFLLFLRSCDCICSESTWKALQHSFSFQLSHRLQLARVTHYKALLWNHSPIFFCCCNKLTMEKNGSKIMNTLMMNIYCMVGCFNDEYVMNDTIFFQTCLYSSSILCALNEKQLRFFLGKPGSTFGITLTNSH